MCFVLLTKTICLTGFAHNGTVQQHVGVPDEMEQRGQYNHIRTISHFIHPAFENPSLHALPIKIAVKKQ